MLKELEDELTIIASKLEDESFDCDGKPVKVDTKRFAMIVRQKMRRILDNPLTRPKFSVEEAYKYYIEGVSARFNLIEAYNEMNEIIDFINMNITTYVYDRIDILNIFRITDGTYGQFIEDASSETFRIENVEDRPLIQNLWISIDKQLLADRNMAAETGQRNSKAIDTVNRYSKKDGGHGVVVKKDNGSVTNQTFILNSENIDKTIDSKFNFAIESNTKSKEI